MKGPMTAGRHKLIDVSYYNNSSSMISTPSGNNPIGSETKMTSRTHHAAAAAVAAASSTRSSGCNADENNKTRKGTVLRTRSNHSHHRSGGGAYSAVGQRGFGVVDGGRCGRGDASAGKTEFDNKQRSTFADAGDPNISCGSSNSGDSTNTVRTTKATTTRSCVMAKAKAAVLVATCLLLLARDLAVVQTVLRRASSSANTSLPSNILLSRLIGGAATLTATAVISNNDDNNNTNTNTNTKTNESGEQKGQNKHKPKQQQQQQSTTSTECIERSKVDPLEDLTAAESLLNLNATATTYATPPFKILCTTTSDVFLRWGSFQIRCRDLKVWINLYYPNVTVDVGYFNNFVYTPSDRKDGNMGKLTARQHDEKTRRYDATILVKTPFPSGKYNEERFGKIYVDVVDSRSMLKRGSRLIPQRNHTVIVQNERMGELFNKVHRTALLTHWYNSYPADLGSEPLRPPPEMVCTSSSSGGDGDRTVLRAAAVWNPDKKTDRSCLSYNEDGHVPDGVLFDCIEEDFHIGRWYARYMPTATAASDGIAEFVLASKRLGPGYLYQALFRQYDALVVLAKGGAKLRYHNFQRVVSQMRSGVPVLLEVEGPNHEDFMAKYPQYRPCGFYTSSEKGNGSTTGLRDLLAEVKQNITLRRSCQTMGIEIAKEYSPFAIVMQYLTAMGLLQDKQKSELVPSSELHVGSNDMLYEKEDI